MNRGDIWLADVGGKPRPVVVLTRDAVLDVRSNVTVAEVTTRARGLTVEVSLDPDVGLDQPSVVNADGLHTISQRRLTRQLGAVTPRQLQDICEAVAVALSCDGA